MIAATVLVGLLLFKGSDAYTVTATFETGGQLVRGNEVQVGGRTVGTVNSIKLTPAGQAQVELEVDDELAPLRQGTTAVIRSNSLSGIANRYVSISPGPSNADAIEDGGRIGADETGAPVDLDQLFATLDPETRRGLQRVIQGSATQYAGKGREAGESLKYLNPALSSSSSLTREIVRDEPVFERFVVDGAKVVSAVAERRSELADLVSNANATTRAIGDESESFARALDLLPGTLRKGNTTFVNLRATLDDLDLLVAESKPATRDLAPFLRRLRPLVADARPTIRDLRVLIKRKGRGNDLLELVAKMPRLNKIASVAFPRAVRALGRAQPVIEYIRPYTPDLAGWFTKFGQGASPFDANGHYARISPLFNAFSLGSTPGGEVLNAVPASQRLGGLEFRQNERCPGGATQPPPDGSAPFRDADGRLDCDPETTPPGP